MNKKILIILFYILINMICVPSIFASSVKINGGVLDIYSSSGNNEAKFDKNNNTLILNGYNNDYILFEGFDEETINIKLVGNNIIHSSGYNGEFISGLGFDYNTSYDKVNMNIEGVNGSKLKISGYYNGIYVPDGKLNISNVNLELSDIYYVGIYTYYGEIISIKDSIIKSNDIGYVVANDSYDIVLDNVNYTSSGTLNGDIYTYKNTRINNSTFNINNSNYFISAKDAIIDNSNIYFSNGVTFVSANNLEFKNSDVNVKTSDFSLNIYESLTIDNSDIVLSADDVALFISNENVNDFNDRVILRDTYVLEENLIPSVVDTHFVLSGIVYSYFTSEPVGPYNEENLNDLISIAANEIHFVAKNTVSFDPNGGSGTMESIKASGEFMLPNSKFIPPKGKVFKGWSLSSDGEIISKVNVNKNITLYAIWEDEIENPQTGDNILSTMIVLSISLFILIVSGIYLFKDKNN